MSNNISSASKEPVSPAKDTAGLRTAFKIGRAADDPEKAILPAILYCNADHAFFSEHRQRGFAIAIGWWDFYLFAAFIATTADLTSPTSPNK